MIPRALLAFVAATVTAAIVATPAAAAQKDLKLSESYPAAAGKRIVVDAADLDVRVRNADVPDIVADVQLHIGGTGADRAERWIENHTPAFDDSEDRLQVVVSPGKAGFLGFGKLSARARLGILAPGSVVPDLTTTSGNIDVRGDFPDAQPLWMRTSSGTLTLVGAAASVDVKSAEGDAEIEVIRPLERFTASTSSGNVRLLGGARETTVGTASGNIWLENLSGNLEATTSTGKITVVWDRLDPDGTVRIRSSSGRVHLMIPAGVNPRGTLTTTTGSVRSELPGEVASDGGTLQLAGDGPVFDVETASGEIILSVRDAID
jgi:DUF4097 and DUF4098 domain-containing protein YvlB